ncbi:Crp/Fnr family transcriptional regulator [Phaeodactylibacter luteus]|uniref:Cyclic nucleotide-binding domain-containing protein n=1 Tax=Phaeodactylibacter luteus TaxID=1564516 RepID=A0A5C6RJC3_9BACT|nr:cyclic nucleotide-binding domain-containing protein [Phaeodactylibacter luteus]TXB62411.1 cyclic nucleotide-binding domain-containing protein [Phaeodactylibacter luteus]
MGLIDSIALEWDLWIGKYRAFFVTETQDREACIRLLPSHGQLHDTLEKGQLVACQDTRSGEVVACVLLRNAAPSLAGPETAFSHVRRHDLPQLAVLSHFSFHNTYLNTPAIPVLLSHCFVEVLKAGGLALLMSSDPGHYSIHKRLGMRPIGPLQKGAHGDFRIPMICLPDMDYLSIINSPLMPMLRGIRFERYQAICEWYYNLVRENKELQTGAAFYPENDQEFKQHHLITDGLSDQGRETLLRDALIINCREGEVVLAENDGGKSFGYVRNGLVRVLIGGQPIVMLGEGDILGEIAFVLNTRRTAQLVAASPDTEVVLFRESAIDQLQLESDRALLWRNLARVLAQRVLVTNKMMS